MGREKILFEDIHELSNVFVYPQLGVVNLIGPINKSPDETHLLRVRGETEVISS